VASIWFFFSTHFWSYLAQVFFAKEMFQKILWKKIKTYIWYMIFNIFLKKNFAFYEIIWKNIVEPDRSQVVI